MEMLIELIIALNNNPNFDGTGKEWSYLLPTQHYSTASNCQNLLRTMTILGQVKVTAHPYGIKKRFTYKPIKHIEINTHG